MKLLLAPLLLAVSLPAFAGAHEECLKAVDYKGCFAARSAVKKPVLSATNGYFTEKLPPQLFELLVNRYDNRPYELMDLLTNKCFEVLPDKQSETKALICSLFVYDTNRLQKAIDEWTDPEILADAAKHNAKFKSSKTYFDVVSPQNELKYTSPCPPGKSLRQKRIFLGLIKLGKVCLSDYEVENLNQRERHRALDNFSDSMKSLGETINPKRINCSTRYGSYSSNTTCY